MEILTCHCHEQIRRVDANPDDSPIFEGYVHVSGLQQGRTACEPDMQSMPAHPQTHGEDWVAGPDGEFYVESERTVLEVRARRGRTQAGSPFIDVRSPSEPAIHPLRLQPGDGIEVAFVVADDADPSEPTVALRKRAVYAITHYDPDGDDRRGTNRSLIDEYGLFAREETAREIIEPMNAEIRKRRADGSQQEWERIQQMRAEHRALVAAGLRPGNSDDHDDPPSSMVRNGRYIEHYDVEEIEVAP